MSSCMEATTVHTEDGTFLSHMEESEMGTDSMSMGFMDPLQPESGTDQTHATYRRDTTPDFFETVVRQDVQFRAAPELQERAPQEPLLLQQLFAPQQLRLNTPRQEAPQATQLNPYAHLAPMVENVMPSVGPSQPGTSHMQVRVPVPTVVLLYQQVREGFPLLPAVEFVWEGEVFLNCN